MPHLNDLFRTASHMLADAARAQDVVQDVYLQAWKSFDQFEPGTNCRAWLYRILFHMVQRHRRKWLSFRMVRESEEILQQAVAHPESPLEDISDASLLAALQEIPQDYRAAVLLVDVSEFSYKEAASVLEIPIGTVMSRLSRGRRLLRERLEQTARSYGLLRQRPKEESA